jgi:pimeloyl-ACP methyl ester carboxylesterase
MVEVMARFGDKQFMVAGHDRGGRVVHRMMLDHPDVVTKGAVLDIAPTLTMYDDTSKEFATKYVWWFFQIQPAPMPEHMISLAVADGAGVSRDEMVVGRIERDQRPLIGCNGAQHILLVHAMAEGLHEAALIVLVSCDLRHSVRYTGRAHLEGVGDRHRRLPL